jgi:hypothetical protein
MFTYIEYYSDSIAREMHEYKSECNLNGILAACPETEGLLNEYFPDYNNFSEYPQ